MKILTLIIKQEYFNQIITGEKKNETRELRPKNEKKYIVYDNEGCYDAIEYDAIRFYVGYNPNRDTALVEVDGCEFQDIVDESGNTIKLEENGEEYDMMNIIYYLGEVLEVNGKIV